MAKFFTHVTFLFLFTLSFNELDVKFSNNYIYNKQTCVLTALIDRH